MIKPIFVSAIAGAALAACSSSQAVYDKASKIDDQGAIKFRMPESQITVNWRKAQDGGSDQVALASVPIDDDTALYTLKGVDSWGTATVLKATPRENSRVLQSVAVEFDDKRAEYIQTAGQVVVGLIGLGLLGPAPASSPTPQSIDVAEILRKNRSECGVHACSLVGNLKNNWVYSLDFGAVSAAAVPRGEFEATLGKATSSLYFPYCRDVVVALTPPSGNDAVATGRFLVHDPDYFETVRLPEKGTVEFLPSCGVAVTASAPGVSGELKVINALIAQAKAIKDAKKAAQDAKKKA